VLSDSEEDIPAAPLNIAPKRDGAESNASPGASTSTHTYAQGFKTDLALSSEPTLDHDVNIDMECGPYTDDEALEIVQGAIYHSVSPKDNLEHDPFVSGIGQNCSQSPRTHSGSFPKEVSTCATVPSSLPDILHHTSVIFPKKNSRARCN
jgi:hypothetical protein